MRSLRISNATMDLNFPDCIHCHFDDISDELFFKMGRGKVISLSGCNLSYIRYEYNGMTIFPTTE
jgi:hypothetical protein